MITNGQIRPEAVLSRYVTGLLARQEIRYLLAGGWNTLFGVGSSFLFYWLLHHRIHYMVILVLTNLLAVSMAYVIYKKYVFCTHGNIFREYIKFYTVYGAAIVFGLVSTPFCIEVVGINFYISQLLILVVTVAFSFVCHKRFSFRGRARAPSC